ncbi:uncharacterized protein LOC142175940 [Nicotiana tabacum]|uniref:Uncharacterized protein LOC142175940 n=1 Tax=Nicotiana tabacum TaxID=4097 RepID=A0AC58TP99_TOBAC
MERMELWDHLYYLASDMELPWLVGGDFNVVLHEDEKIGGLPVHPPEYEDFAFCVNSCGLFEQGSCTIANDMWGADNNFVKPFRFLNFWTKHATFMDVVRQNWEDDFIGYPFLMFKQNIKRVKAALSKWSKETFGDIFKQLAILEDSFRVKEMLFEEEPTIKNRIVLQKAQSELKKYLSIEELYWKQKAGMIWFTEGDRNTSFFHNHVNSERKKLQLKRIKSGSGVWIEDQEQLATTTNLELSRLPTIEEVRATVFELSGESASGPDGFTGLFYQTCWDVIGADIHNMIGEFFPSLISPNQSGFVKGRSIFENILLTQEIVTDIRLKGKPANVVIKLDMAKAYDRVSWKYLLHVLRKMGFS